MIGKLSHSGQPLISEAVETQTDSAKTASTSASLGIAQNADTFESGPSYATNLSVFTDTSQSFDSTRAPANATETVDAASIFEDPQLPEQQIIPGNTVNIDSFLPIGGWSVPSDVPISERITSPAYSIPDLAKGVEGIAQPEQTDRDRTSIDFNFIDPPKGSPGAASTSTDVASISNWPEQEPPLQIPIPGTNGDWDDLLPSGGWKIPEGSPSDRFIKSRSAINHDATSTEGLNSAPRTDRERTSIELNLGDSKESVASAASSVTMPVSAKRQQVQHLIDQINQLILSVPPDQQSYWQNLLEEKIKSHFYARPITDPLAALRGPRYIPLEDDMIHWDSALSDFEDLLAQVQAAQQPTQVNLQDP